MPKHEVDITSREYQEEQLWMCSDGILEYEGRNAYYQQRAMPDDDTLIRMIWRGYYAMQLLDVFRDRDITQIPDPEEVDPALVPSYLLTYEQARGILWESADK